MIVELSKQSWKENNKLGVCLKIFNFPFIYEMVKNISKGGGATTLHRMKLLL